MILKKKKGFTLIEAMLTVLILSIVSIGVYKMMDDGIKIWNYGTAKLSISSEARIAIAALTKFIHNAIGNSIKISRYDNTQPAASYIAAFVVDPIYVTTTFSNCGCCSSSDTLTVGIPGDYVKIYQYNNNLVINFPVIPPGTDLTSGSDVQNKIYYRNITLSTHLDSLMVYFKDGPENKTLNIAARFSKKVGNDVIKIFLKKSVVIKHRHSAGYYYN